MAGVDQSLRTLYVSGVQITPHACAHFMIKAFFCAELSALAVIENSIVRQLPECVRMTMPSIKLYGSTGLSVGTTRVVAALYEKDLTDWEYVPLSLASGDHKKPEFLALQPLGEVPVLMYGDLALFESRAIIRAVANKFVDQGPPLYGYAPKDRAVVEVWMEVEGQNYAGPVADILRETVYKSEQPDQAVVDAAGAKVTKVLDIYEAQLAKTKYLAGDFFSLADLSNLPPTYFLVHAAKLGHFIESRPHVKAWFEDISSRPAWKKTLAITGA